MKARGATGNSHSQSGNSNSNSNSNYNYNMNNSSSSTAPYVNTASTLANPSANPSLTRALARTVNSNTSNITYSADVTGTAAQSRAELDVLKCILNREAYLSRLLRQASALKKVFKGEVADLLDFVRVASLDVVEAIGKWREQKGDPEAAFLWNENNYLLKMTHDLDSLDNMKVVRAWMGCSLARNPFAVPLPMEQGQPYLSERTADPGHTETKEATDGFYVGGGKLSPKAKPPPEPSPYDTHTHTSGKSKKMSNLAEAAEPASSFVSKSSSFVLNSDMGRIRRAEKVIMDEERRWNMLLEEFERSQQFAGKMDEDRLEEDDADAWMASQGQGMDLGASVAEMSESMDGGHSPMFAQSATSFSLKGAQSSELQGTAAGENGTRSRGSSRLPDTSKATKPKKKTLSERLAEIGAMREEITKAKLALNAYDATAGEEAKFKKTPTARRLLSNSGNANPNMLRTMSADGKPQPPLSKNLANTYSYSNNIASESISDADKTPLKKFQAPNVTSELASTMELDKAMPSTPFEDTKPWTSDLKKENARRSSVVDKLAQAPGSSALEASRARSSSTDSIVSKGSKTGTRTATAERGAVEEKTEMDDLGSESSNKSKGRLPERTVTSKFDVFAIRIQRVIRGFIIRSWVKWFRGVNIAASTCCQRIMRGFLARRRVNRLLRAYRNASTIQRAFRGFKARVKCREILTNRRRHAAAIRIQKIARGILGRERASHKRTLEEGIRESVFAVDARALSVHDVRDLGRRILNATLDPAVSYPPDEVLQLIRMSVAIIQAAGLPMGSPGFGSGNADANTFINANAEQLSWHEAAQIMNRSERFLRTVRIVALGPGAQPPALLRIPPSCISIYNAQSKSHRWSLPTFENMGMGSKFCCQLFRWLRSLLVVSQRQQEFLSFIVTSYPAWFPPLYSVQASARKCEMEVRINTRCIDVLKEQIERSRDDRVLIGLLETDIALLLAENRESNEFIDELGEQADALKQAQSEKEDSDRAQLLAQVKDVRSIFLEKAAIYDATNKKAVEGDKESMLLLSGLRVQLTHEKHRLTALESKLTLLDLQIQKNNRHRKDPAKLPLEINVACVHSGEAKALHLTAICRTKVMLRASGIRNPKDLPYDFIDIYNNLVAKEDAAKVEYSRSYTFVNELRDKYDERRMEALLKLQREESRGKELLSPTDVELQENARESAKQAINERNLKLDFVPDNLINPPKCRPRPVLLALSRDLPSNATSRLQAEITKLVPGTFVTVDVERNLGLDIKMLQTIVDAGKSVILSVDPGLTKITRQNFTNALEHTIKTLSPSPFVVIALGDEANKRLPSSNAATHYGTHNYDLSIMVDGDIKVGLETMSWVLDELLSEAIVGEVRELTSQPVPPNSSYRLVLEAFFLIQASDDLSFRSPEQLAAGVKWRVTCQTMKELPKVVEFLKNLKRGKASTQLLEFLAAHIANPAWPKVPESNGDNTRQRQGSTALHLLALYVELWRESEKRTADRGGLPSQLLSKSSLKGIQSVVVVSDSRDAEDTQMASARSTATGWRSASARLLRTILQDMRVVKTVRKIEDELFNVSAYREEGTVYLDAYHPTTSELYICTVPSFRIPSLLYPSSLTKEAGGIDSRPPATAEEMYHRLIRLLKFEKFISKSSNAKRVLYCNRDYTFIEKVSTIIDGHRAYLYIYEAALGEIYYTAHVPEFSSNLTCLVALDTRVKLMAKNLVENERKALEKETVAAMKSFVTDRLQIFPSRSSVLSRGIDQIRKGQFNDRLEVPILHKTQGLQLKLRLPGGYGKAIVRRVIRVAETLQLMTIYRCTQDNSLRVVLYEPLHQERLETTISNFLRKMFFSADTDAYRRWLNELIPRLKIIWRGKHHLKIDKTIAKSVKKVDGRRLRISVSLIDEDSVDVTVVDPMGSKSFCCKMSREDVARVFFFQPTLDLIEKNSGMRVADENVRDILKSMTQRSTTQSTSAGELDLKELDPETLSTPLFDMLREPAKADKFVSRFAFLLHRDIGDMSYTLKITYSNTVFEKKLTLDEEQSVASVRMGVALDTSVKHANTSVPRVPTDDFEEFIRSRRQLSSVNIENELNAMAQAKSLEATARLQEELRLAELASQPSVVVEVPEELEPLPHMRRRPKGTPALSEYHYAIEFEQEAKPVTYSILSKDNSEMVEIERDSLSADDIERIEKGEIVVFEGGIKTTYREGKHRWFGHVGVKVFESCCWLGEWGLGRRLRFVVFEPGCSQHFEGILRNTDEIREALGVKGEKLMVPERQREMLTFIAKYRLEVVKISATYDGIEEGVVSPLFRIDFQNEKLYSSSKVTPIHLGGDMDLEANKAKLVDIQKRGRKLLRLARRVSGILMQLTVFEMPNPSGKFIQEEMAEAERERIKKGGRALQEPEPPAGSPIKEFAENRSKTKVRKFDAPTLRIIGYDPKKKRTTITVAVPEAVYELVGGVYSTYLDPFYRKDMARLICEALTLYFPRGRDYEVVVPWTGTKNLISNAVVSSTTVTKRSSAERVMKRSGGKLFRSGMRMNSLDCVVSVYAHSVPIVVDEAAALSGTDEPPPEPENSVIINVYTQGASEAEELFISEKDQMLRVGRPIVHFPEGAARALAIRKLCKFMRCELNPDPESEGRFKLYLELLQASTGHVTETGNLNPPTEHDYVEKQFAMPHLFERGAPLGYCIARKQVYLPNQDPNIDKKLFMISAYSRSRTDGVDRGIIMKVYEKGSTVTSVLHIGHSELLRLSAQAKLPNLVTDMIKAKEDADSEATDSFADCYEMQVEPGSAMHRYQQIVETAVTLVLGDLCMLGERPEEYIPFFRSKVAV